MTIGSLFSGIGGFELGFLQAGLCTLDDIKWQVEINSFCNRVLERHFPNAKRYGDIRDVGRHNLEPVDLICGGSPCQPFSCAGKRKGREDDRYLWPEMFRVIGELHPARVVYENVPGGIRETVDTISENLESIGYWSIPLVIPACEVGADHERKRLFIIAEKFVVWPCEYIFEEWDDEHEYPQCPICKTDFSECWHDGCTSWIDEPITADIARQRMEGLRATWEQVTQSLDKTLLSVRDSNGQWKVEPDVCRITHGVSHRVDRLKSLGNAVVPQVVQAIGEIIVAWEREQCTHTCK